MPIGSYLFDFKYDLPIFIDMPTLCLIICFLYVCEFLIRSIHFIIYFKLNDYDNVFVM